MPGSDHKTPARGVKAAVSAYLDTLELDAVGQTRAAIALSLASALDAAEGATSGAVAQAVAGTSRELRACLAELTGDLRVGDELLERIFGRKR